MKSYNASVRGYSHILKNLPCQDCSLKKEFENGIVLVVSDGHGSVPRSDRGSKFACEKAVEKTVDFVRENYDYIKQQNGTSYGPDAGTLQDEKLKVLFSDIYDAWCECVRGDLNDNPLSNYSGDPESAYGCTLIVGVKTADFIFGFQIGDGRFFSISYTNEWTQPIPWDKSCEDNYTTSLCQNDAVNRFRYYIDGVKEKRPFAMFLCSDGIEDCYEGYHDARFKSEELTLVYSNLLNLQDERVFDSDCKTFLEKESKNRGNHDDMSIAFAVDDYKNLQDKWGELIGEQIALYEIKAQQEKYDRGITDLNNSIENVSRNIETLGSEILKINGKISDCNIKKAKLEDDIKQLGTDRDLGNRFWGSISVFFSMIEDFLSKVEKGKTGFMLRLISTVRTGINDINTQIVSAVGEKYEAIGKCSREIEELKKEIDAKSAYKTRLDYERKLQTERKRALKAERDETFSKLTDFRSNNEGKWKDLEIKIGELQEKLSQEVEKEEKQETAESEAGNENVDWAQCRCIVVKKWSKESSDDEYFQLEWNETEGENCKLSYKDNLVQVRHETLIKVIMKAIDNDKVSSERPSEKPYLSIQEDPTSDSKYISDPDTVKEIWESFTGAYSNEGNSSVE